MSIGWQHYIKAALSRLEHPRKAIANKNKSKPRSQPVTLKKASTDPIGHVVIGSHSYAKPPPKPGKNIEIEEGTNSKPPRSSLQKSVTT